MLVLAVMSLKGNAYGLSRSFGEGACGCGIGLILIELFTDQISICLLPKKTYTQVIKKYYLYQNMKINK